MWQRRSLAPWLLLVALLLLAAERRTEVFSWTFSAGSAPRGTALRGAVGAVSPAKTGGGSVRDAGSTTSAQLVLGLLGAGCAVRTAGRRGKARDAVEEALGPDFFQQLRPSSNGSLRPLIVAMGTRGDAEPGFRLAAALQERGHQPLVVSLDAYKEEAVSRWGLDFRSCGIDKVPISEDYLTGSTRADQVYSDRGWYGDAWTTVGDRIFAAATEHHCDVIVTTSMGNTHCLDVAENLDLLCFALKFCPDIDGQVPTGDFPPSGYPSLPGPLNYLQHVLENSRTVAAVFRGGYIPKVIDFRKSLGMESMEIPGAGVKVPTYSEIRQRQQSNQPSLYAFSNALAERPKEYPSWHFITGSFSEASPKARPSEGLRGALSQFLNEEPPICVAFGSITLARSLPWAPFEHRAVAAARRQNRPVLVVDPELQGDEGPDADDPAVFRIRSAPYSSLFPRCCLVVHHGGAGTAQDAIVAETPQLVVPVLSWSDQPFWAKELEERRLGIKLGDGGQAPSEEDWDLAFQRALRNLEDFAEAAKAVKQRMAQEGGVEAACEIIEDVLSR